MSTILLEKIMRILYLFLPNHMVCIVSMYVQEKVFTDFQIREIKKIQLFDRILIIEKIF